MSNTEEFLKIFNELEAYLRKLVNEPRYNPFKNLINEAKKKNPAVGEYANDLWEFAELRNGLVHAARDKILAEVNDTGLCLIKEISQKIKCPPTAFDIATKSVHVCQMDDHLLSEIKIMKEKIFTHVPVYEGNRFIGILSESSIFNWQCETTKENFISQDMKVRDIKKFLDINNRLNEYFEFVSKGTNAYLIKQWFTEAIKKNKRLGAVFVTENGKQDGKMLGIITAWDLPRIK